MQFLQISNLGKAVVSAAIYAAMLIAVNHLMNIGLLEIRFGAFWPPLVGMVWGLPGAIGAALGNIVRDIVVGDDLAAIPIGALANFLFAYVPYRLWLATNLGKAEDERFRPTTNSLLRYFLMLTAGAITGTIFLIVGVTLVGYKLPEYFARQVFVANFDFPLLLATPLLILLAGKGAMFPLPGGAVARPREAGAVARPLSFTITFIVMLSGMGFIVIFSAIFFTNETMNGNTNIAEIFGTLYLFHFFLLHLFLVLTFFLLRTAEKYLVEPLTDMSHSIKAFAGQKGQLGIVALPTIHTGNELELLRDSFSQMMHDIIDYMERLREITGERERAAAELSIAKNIQLGLLPQVFPPYPERHDFDIFATMTAAKQVGGDFYDFYLLDDDHIVITIADVSGKGVPAALFMATAKLILKNFALAIGKPTDITRVIAKANDQLCLHNDAAMFVTAFMGILDTRCGRFVFVNAGHNPPLIYRKAAANFSELPLKRNFVLGGMDGLAFVQQETTLNTGDIIFLYTDGVTEAMDEDGNQYTLGRLQQCLDEAGGNLPLPGLAAEVSRSMAAHVKDAEQSDDITMLLLKYLGNPSERSHL